MRHLSCRGRCSRLIQASLQGQCVSSLWGDEALARSRLPVFLLSSFRPSGCSPRPLRPPRPPRPPSVISTWWEKTTASLFVPLIRPPPSCRSGTFWNESSFVFFILSQTETDVLVLSWTCSPPGFRRPPQGVLEQVLHQVTILSPTSPSGTSSSPRA